MRFFILSLCFWVITLFSGIFTLYLYAILIRAVKEGRDIPHWMYAIGHAVKGRGPDRFENLTDRQALRLVNINFLGFILVNVICFFTMLMQGKTFFAALSFCTRTAFVIVLLVQILTGIGCLLFSLILKKADNLHNYASTNAVMGMLFISLFFLFLSVMLTGVPVKAPSVQIGDAKIIVGDTKAQELLEKGFYFSRKDEDDIIRNLREDHFYYGESAELMKNGKSCGFVQLTPKFGDTASLRDCVITLFEAYREGGQLNNLRINGREVNNLSWNEFKHHTAMDIFALDRTDYLETNGMRDFFVTLQTRPYMLWKCYAVAGYFDEDGSPEQYLVCARHTIWE